MVESALTVSELQRLSPLELRVLAVAAMLAPCSRTALSERLYRLRVSRGGGEPISHAESEAILKPWIACGWLSARSEGLWMAPELRWRTLRFAEAEGHLELLISAAEEFSVLGFRGLADAQGAFRAALFKGIPEQARVSLRRCRELDPVRFAFEHPLLEAVATDLDVAWFEALAPGIQLQAREAALTLGLEGCADLGEYWPYLVTHAHAYTEDEQATLALVALLRGERDTALALAVAADSPLVLGMLALMNGDRPVAEAHWLPQSGTKARAIGSFPAGLIGMLRIVLAATSEDPAALRHAERFVHQQTRGDSLSRTAGPILKSLLQAVKTPQSVALAKHMGTRIAYSDVATPIVRGLYALWYLDHSFELARTASDLRQSAAEARQRGYAWLAAQCAALSQALAKKLGNNPRRFEFGIDSTALEFEDLSEAFWISDLRQDRSGWERSLNALSMVGRRPDARPVAPVSELRLAWLVHLQDFLVEPIVQRLHADGWSAGRSVPLRQLIPGGEQRALVRKHDEAAVQLVLSQAPAAPAEVAARHALSADDVLPLLVDHPLVFIAPERTRPIDLVAGVCALRVLPVPGGVRLLPEPPGLDLAAKGARVQLAREGARWAVYAPSAQQREALALLGEGLFIPQAGRAQLAEVLARLGHVLTVQSAVASEVAPRRADGRVGLRLVPLAGEFNLTCFVRPFAVLGSASYGPGQGDAQLTRAFDGQLVTVLRDLEAERRIFESILTLSPELQGCDQGSFTWTLPSAHALLAFLSGVEALGASVFIEWPKGEALRLHRPSTGSSFRGKVAFEPGWYLVTGNLRLDTGAALELSELLKALQRSPGRFVPVAENEFVELDADLERQLRLLLASRVNASEPGPLRVPSCALAVLDVLSQPNTPFELTEPVANWRQRFDAIFTREYALPDELQGELRSYQQHGYVWLRRLTDFGLGACLADDMGLGKTVTILAVLLARASEGPALVVAPTSVCANWLREAARFAPTLRVIDYADSRRQTYAMEPNLVIVVSYGLLQRDLAAFSANEWASVVLDEAQFVKNSNAQRAKAVLSLRAKARIAATGTPIENRTSDLYGLFRFLNPGLLGDPRQFEARFGELGQAPDAEQTRLFELRLLLSPFVLRRTKAEVMSDLPPLTVIDECVEFSDYEQSLYDGLREEALRVVVERGRTEPGKPSPTKILAQITKLRRFCCDPRLVYPEFSGTSAKLEAVMQRLEQLSLGGHRVLVFSQFVGMLKLLRDELAQRRISTSYLDGATERRARQRQIDEFQAGETCVFLISLKAGGVGLNLTAADYVIHVDPWWNPAVEAQATDRAHRSGQERPVTAYRFAVSGTVEIRILELHERKRDLSSRVLDATDQGLGLSAEQLLEILTGAI